MILSLGAVLLGAVVCTKAAPAVVTISNNTTTAAIGTASINTTVTLGTGIPSLSGAIPTSIRRPTFLMPNGTGTTGTGSFGFPAASGIRPTGTASGTTDTGVTSSQTTPGSQSSSPSPKLSSDIRFNATGPWTTVQCTTNITDETILASTRWSAADASDALDQLLAAYNSPQPSGSVHLSFPQFAFNAFSLNSGANCGDANDPGCDATVTCDPNNSGLPAAASLIINSLVTMHNLIQENTAALQAAEGIVAGNAVSFANTFAKMQDAHNFLIATEILDALGFVLGLGIGSIFDAIVAVTTEEVTQAILKQVRSVSTAGISYGISAGKDAMTKPSNPFQEAQTLESLLQTFYQQFVLTQTAFLESVMAGDSSTSQDQLKSLVDNGFMLSIQQGEQSNQFSNLLAASAQMLYGRLIPAAWQISQNHQNPFILRVDRSQYKCGDAVSNSGKFSLDQYMSDDTANKTHYCDQEGNTWFLLNAVDDQYEPFQALDGGDIDTLNSYNLTIADFIKSTYGGFMANGQKNGYQLPSNSSLMIDDSFNIVDGVLPFIGGITTPGFFNLTVCLSSTEAAGGIQAGNLTAPCPVSPSEDLVSPEVNSAGYTPGWCGVHVDLVQKHEKNINPTGNYQLSVTITDSANQVIGYAAKQDASDALVVQSKLPYDLIVATGSIDSDPLSFWYADQWWLSVDQQHHCNLGPFNNGEAQGDCGFTCSNPTNSPPHSATVPLPTAVTTANSASHPATGTATAVTTSTPTSTTKPSYATGWCGIHVRQWQKNEPENPTGQYAVEITIFDANQKLIFDSGEKNTADNAPVSIQGPLPSPLNVTVTSPDDSPVTFAYAGQNWAYADKGHSCNFGQFANGHRDGDCGFTC